MTIHVVGGVYREHCIHPRWNEIFGSAGRAALAIAGMGTAVRLHSYMEQRTLEVLNEKAAWLPSFAIEPTVINSGVSFRYCHDLAVPDIEGVPDPKHRMLEVSEEKVVRFGMLEGDARVRAEWVVYDPQNAHESEPFGANGSVAKHLALVLNLREAAQMAGMPGEPPSTVAPALAQSQSAEVVILKMGPRGAYVWSASGAAQVPVYRTKRVWKIGSGDCFVAYFANAWMQDRLAPAAAADIASRATAYYSETQGFATRNNLTDGTFTRVELSSECRAGKPRMVYLAGPFFDLMQLWMVEQARSNLLEMGLHVFSPYHDVGSGRADDVISDDLEGIRNSDLVFAIADGLDSGTLFEVGYARAQGKPVVVYSERHKDSESLKTMEGSGCVMCQEYATAVYSAVWEAAKI